MTTRDRLVLMGIVTLAVLAGGWLLLVSPERQQASKITAQVSAAHQQLEEARSQVANARDAQKQYSSAYASMVRLGKAVPAEPQIPSLVYQLDHASNQRQVSFASITDTGVTTQPGAGASASATAGAKVAPPGFTQVPFTFIFRGSYFSLYHLMNQLNHFVLNTSSGGVQVTGRLLTIQDANLDLKDEGGSSSGASKGMLTGTITATAYILPASQGLTAGATPSSPAGVAGGSQPASGSGSPSTPSTPAVVKVNP